MLGIAKTSDAKILQLFCLLVCVALPLLTDCAPSFTSTPNNPVYQLQGNDVILSWFYNPDGKTVDNITWSFNINQRIATKHSNGVNTDPAYTDRVEVSGSATIKLKNIQAKDSGTYYCIVKFTTFDWIINLVELIVVVGPQITLRTSGPAITIDEGNTRTLLCVASGNPKPNITWYRDNVKVQEDPNNSNYTITSATRNHAGTYRCEAVVTAPGLSINPAEYTVAVTVRFKPQHRVNSLQSNQTKVEGRNAEFYCRLEAVPSGITYRWFKGGSQILDPEDYTIGTISDGQRLTVKKVKKRSAGQYSCEGQNTLGTGERKSVYLLVNYPPQQVTVTPNPADVKLTQSITLTCDADGFPKPSYSWKFNGKLNGIRQNTVTVTNVDVNDAGNYTCVAKNDFGNKETTRVVNVEYRPTVTTFTTGTTDNSVVQGTTVTLTCSANGYPAPIYTIKRGDSPVNSVEGKHVIPNIQLSDEADTYSCEPQNSEGTGPTKQLQITVLVTTAAINTNGNEMDNQKGILSTGAVREVVITIIAILVVIILALAVYLRRKRKSERIAEQSRNEPHSSEFVNEAIEIELQHSALPRTENDLVRLSHVDDEPMAAEAERSEMGGYDVPTEFIYPEELTPCTKETGPQFMEYQTLDRATMDWEIARNKVSIVKVIGEGAFGKVAKATVKDVRGIPGERTVAVKMTKAHATESERNTLLSELEIMKRLKPHPHVIKLLGCVTTSDPLMVLIEYIPYGDLLGFLRRSRGLNDKYYKDPDIMPKTSLTSDQLLKFAFEIADGMSFLAFNKIIHRDLAARNVLVGDNETCKVTDFGMARESDYERKSGGRLPVKWTAYEALMYGQYTTKSDVWSYGILLYEIFTIGGKPYPKINGRQIASFLEEGKRMAKPKHLDDYLFQIMMNCWHENPQDRPTFESLKIIMELMKTTRKELFRWEKYEKHLYENVEISELL
ncbi:fibroblast growth factor receptor 3-like isoform X2 [Oculina patagonica]